MQRRILYSIFGVLLFVHGCDDGDGPGSGRDATGPTPDMGTSVLDGKVTNSDGGLDQGTGTRPDSGSDPDMALGADSGEGSDAGPVTDAQPVTDASNLDAGPRPLDGGGRVDGGPVLADGGEADAQQVGCLPPATHLRFSTWPAVFQNRCTNCHLEGGFAEQYEEDPSSFVLQDPNDLSRGRTVDAIFQQDTPVIIGCFFSFTLLVLVGNMLADIAYTLIDPRIEYTRPCKLPPPPIQRRPASPGRGMSCRAWVTC